MILFAVGGEGHSAVEEHFEVGPHLIDGLCAAAFEHFHQHGHHPRGHACDGSHVFVEGFFGDEFAFAVEIFEQGRRLRGHAEETHEGRGVFVENRAQITHARGGRVVVGLVTAAENERAAGEQSAVGAVAQIEGHGVAATGVVEVLQTAVAHGDELALVVRRAR